jgi:hypothetical protein
MIEGDKTPLIVSRKLVIALMNPDDMLQLIHKQDIEITELKGRVDSMEKTQEKLVKKSDQNQALLLTVLATGLANLVFMVIGK